MPPTTNPATAQCACTTLRKASRAVARHYEAQLSRVGLTATQFAILRAVERAGSLPLSRLAERLVMDRTSLYRAIQPLLRQSLIVLRPTRDRRVKEIGLTRRGLQKIRAGVPRWEEAQRSFLSRYGEAAWADLSLALGRVIEQIQGV